MAEQMQGATRQQGEEQEVNEVCLVGRVSGAVEHRELPSGDELVSFRVVVRRKPRRDQRTKTPGVDTIDIACWTARTRASADRLDDGSRVRVEGALRRRFFATPAGRASRYEVEAQRIRRD